MTYIQHIRAQFPAYTHSPDLVYLDSAATSQKPAAVIESISDYYQHANANVHRGIHTLTAQSTEQFEQARDVVQQFLGAKTRQEIIWTRGTTEAINLVANSFLLPRLRADDEILVPESEHHANIVPWQLIAQKAHAKVIAIPVSEAGIISTEQLKSLINAKTRFIAVAHMTNVTGARQPIEQIIDIAHQHNIPVLVDGAQGVVHEEVNVEKLGADFYTFSGHKLFGPTGIGALYARQAHLEEMTPWHGGGKMVQKVSFDGTTFSAAPAKFEAGTPNIAGAIGLASAITWFNQLPRDDIEQHLHALQRYTFEKLSELDDIVILGYQEKSSIISFIVKDVHHQDIATLLDEQGISVRTGHHCAHPFMSRLGVDGTIRVSSALYNQKKDIDQLVSALKKALELLA